MISESFTVDALQRGGLQLRPDDLLVFAQKVVSKAEGRQVDLASVTPGTRRCNWRAPCRRIRGWWSWSCASRVAWCVPHRTY